MNEVNERSAWMSNWMNARMSEWTNGRMDGWMEGWMDEWTNGWMNETNECMSACMNAVSEWLEECLQWMQFMRWAK